jgi:ubiquinone/menaquinone biosynthesis C-methylase UbiE
MMTVIHDWPCYLREIFRVTAPGGHIQLTEMSINVTSQSRGLRADSGLKVMERTLQRYAALKHFDFQIGSKLSHLAEAAGFHSVEEKVVEVPLGAWQSG